MTLILIDRHPVLVGGKDSVTRTAISAAAAVPGRLSTRTSHTPSPRRAAAMGWAYNAGIAISLPPPTEDPLLTVNHRAEPLL